MFDRLFAHTQKERKNKNTIAKFENYILNILLKLILLLYQDQLKVSTHNKKTYFQNYHHSNCNI